MNRRHELYPQRTWNLCARLLVLAWTSASTFVHAEPDPAAGFQLHPDFAIELVAAEPIVQDPVAFDWGLDGRLWVVEMGDYPLGVDNNGRPGGRVKILQDSDGDGRFDRFHVFLEDLLFPTSVMTWRRGVLVACAPDIFYAEDTDGDGRADRREVLFTGFGEANPQHRVNALRWGLDNWVHCANGDFAPQRQQARPLQKNAADANLSGFSVSQAEDLRRLAVGSARITSVRTGESVDMRNRDLRIRPDDGRLDPQAGQSQFGRDRDDWGNWFACNHSTPMWHYALADHYLRRNAHLTPPSARVIVSQSLTFAVGSSGRTTGSRRNASGNPFTSACSVTIYRDTLFGDAFKDNWFVCEPVHNLIHREVLSPTGVTFTSRRAEGEEEREFLASSNPMFTPVAVRTGPDGALWIADMQRLVLEHPHWLPAGWEMNVDVRQGHDKGRLYRVFPKRRPPRPVPRFDERTTGELVSLLASPNGWQRDLSQRMLIQRCDPTAVEFLERQVHKSTPLGRLHSLCTLDGLGALTPGILRLALFDRHSGVRQHAVRLCERELLSSPALGVTIADLVDDPSSHVRLQVAYTLGMWDDPRAGGALASLLSRDGSDPHISAAALSAVNCHNLLPLVTAVVEKAPTPKVMGPLLASATGFRRSRPLGLLLDAITRMPRNGFPAQPLTLLADWLDALDQRGLPLATLYRDGDKTLRSKLDGLRPLFTTARDSMASDDTTPSQRATALRLLGRGLARQREDRDTLAKWLAPQVDSVTQHSAVNGLGRLTSPEVGPLLLEQWKTYSPALREKVVDVLLRREAWLNSLLDNLEDEFVSATEIQAAYRERILDHPSAEVRARAATIFTARAQTDRVQVVAAYAPALKLPGNYSRGKRVFTTTCAGCHRLGEIGRDVGPDLRFARDKPPEWFLPTLFDPSRAVDAKYVNYTAITVDGRTFNGFVREENSQSITLIGPTGEPQVLLRTNVALLSSSGKSAMPEGLEAELKLEQVADLIAFLRRNP